MPVVRLPVSGDYIDGDLVRGVAARGVRGEPGLVTIWLAASNEEGGMVYCFQAFHVESLARAQQLRDEIADMCGLTSECDDANYDESDAASEDGDDAESHEALREMDAPSNRRH